MYIPDPAKAYKAAQKAFSCGLAFNTVCEWCGWSGNITEMPGCARHPKSLEDLFCPLCDGWCEWKLWDDMQD